MSDYFDFSGGKKSNKTDFEKTKTYEPFRVNLQFARVVHTEHRSGEGKDTGEKLVCVKCGDDTFSVHSLSLNDTNKEILQAQCNTCYTAYLLDADFWRVAIRDN